jgi:hypothetical protein
MGRGNADQGPGAAFLQAVQHPGDAHARIDDHGNGPHFEQGEDQGEEIQAGFDHEDGAHAATDANVVETLGQDSPIRCPTDER